MTFFKTVPRISKLLNLVIRQSDGVPIETVSKLLGHTKIATTQIYARVIERKVSEDMAVLKSKLNKRIDGTKKII